MIDEDQMRGGQQKPINHSGRFQIRKDKMCLVKAKQTIFRRRFIIEFFLMICLQEPRLVSGMRTGYSPV